MQIFFRPTARFGSNYQVLLYKEPVPEVLSQAFLGPLATQLQIPITVKNENAAVLHVPDEKDAQFERDFQFYYSTFELKKRSDNELKALEAQPKTRF